MKQYLVPGMINALREQMDTLLVDEEKLKGCQDAGWLGEGRQALDPAWFYHVWDPQQKCEVRSHTEIMKDLDALTKVLQMHEAADGKSGWSSGTLPLLHQPAHARGSEERGGLGRPTPGAACRVVRLDASAGPTVPQARLANPVS